MSEWYDNQKKLTGDFRKLLQECIDKTNLHGAELTTNDNQRLGKVEEISA